MTNGFTSKLIDLYLTKAAGVGARHKTGTTEFIAIEVLRGVAHTYRHDLESFPYPIIEAFDSAIAAITAGDGSG